MIVNYGNVYVAKLCPPTVLFLAVFYFSGFNVLLLPIGNLSRVKVWFCPTSFSLFVPYTFPQPQTLPVLQACSLSFSPEAIIRVVKCSSQHILAPFSITNLLKNHNWPCLQYRPCKAAEVNMCFDRYTSSRLFRCVCLGIGASADNILYYNSLAE